MRPGDLYAPKCRGLAPVYCCNGLMLEGYIMTSDAGERVVADEEEWVNVSKAFRHLQVGRSLLFRRPNGWLTVGVVIERYHMENFPHLLVKTFSGRENWITWKRPQDPHGQCYY